jgi:hypothetical protein
MPALEGALAVGSARRTDRQKPREIAADDLLLELTVTNKSAQPVRFNVLQAAHPSLVLEVEGPSGQRVLLPPPSAPSEDEIAPGEPLEPGTSVALEYRGFVDPSLGPGTFRVRYVGRFPALGGSPGDPLVTDWVEFELPPPVPWPKPKPPWLVPWWVFKEWWRWLIELILGRFRRCQRVWEQEVDEARTETISNAPPGAEAWNGTYGWRSRFFLRIEEASCVVRVIVRIRATGATAAQQSAWKTSIENVWSNIFKLCAGSRCCSNGFDIVAEVQFVASGEHQVVVAGASTTNMGNWGASDTIDVGHEFGHMLGCLEEYFTINGTDWGAARQPGAPIMNNPANPPVARNFELVRSQAQGLMAAACTTKAAADPC